MFWLLRKFRKFRGLIFQHTPGKLFEAFSLPRREKGYQGGESLSSHTEIPGLCSLEPFCREEEDVAPGTRILLLVTKHVCPSLLPATCGCMSTLSHKRICVPFRNKMTPNLAPHLVS